VRVENRFHLLGNKRTDAQVNNTKTFKAKDTKVGVHASSRAGFPHARSARHMPRTRRVLPDILLPRG
jgi:hypothetical protein